MGVRLVSRAAQKVLASVLMKSTLCAMTIRAILGSASARDKVCWEPRDFADQLADDCHIGSP